MKIIISHDVDVITFWEHKNNLIVIKHLIRTFLKFLNGNITNKELKQRIKDFIDNKWNNLEELTEFDLKMGIPSTFFFGVNNGLGLSYNLLCASNWIKKVKEKGFDVGVHGIYFDDIQCMKREYTTFEEIANKSNFGIRMHYLRNNHNTLYNLDKIGYLYDSSQYSFLDVYREKFIWEFPLHIMDVNILKCGCVFQKIDLEKVKRETIVLINEAENMGFRYFIILFHDNRFNNGYYNAMNWYIWLMNWLKKHNYEFINYKNAINELGENDYL